MIFLLWPIIGIVILWVHTPYWMRTRDPFGFAMMHLCAAVAGPVLFLGVLLSPRTAMDDEYDARARARKEIERKSP